MKREHLVIVISMILLVVTAVWAIPVYAFGGNNSGQSSQTTQQVHKIRILTRLLLIQDEAKVNAIIAKAENSGKISTEQAEKIKEFWTNHHTQFAKRAVLVRLLRANDESKVHEILNKAAVNGKITQTQVDNIIALWEKLHTK